MLGHTDSLSQPIIAKWSSRYKSSTEPWNRGHCDTHSYDEVIGWVILTHYPKLSFFIYQKVLRVQDKITRI